MFGFFALIWTWTGINQIIINVSRKYAFIRLIDQLLVKWTGPPSVHLYVWCLPGCVNLEDTAPREVVNVCHMSSWHRRRRAEIISKSQRRQTRCLKSAKTVRRQSNLACSVMCQVADGSLSRLLQVPIRSGDSGSLPTCRQSTFVHSCLFFSYIYLFVFNHSHFFDQTPWDNLLSWQWDFFPLKLAQS